MIKKWLQMWVIGIGLIVHTFVNNGFVGAVTPLNPCDPMQNNVSVASVLTGEIKAVMVDYQIYPSWFVDPLRYVNCGRRGLFTIPTTIPTNVQFLDLSANIVNQVQRKDLEKFVDLQVLWLYSNCIGDSSVVHSYCKGTGAYDRNAFSSLVNLKYLNIGGNCFDHLPANLPPSLEHLEISRSGLEKVTENDVRHLKNLTAFIAENMCFSQNCSNNFTIDPNAFENASLNILMLSDNSVSMKMVSKLNLRQIVYVQLARTHMTTLQAEHFEAISSVQSLNMYLLNPDERNTYVLVENRTFDKLLNLERLDLSCNLIRFLPNNIFQYNLKLSYLDLSGNCLYPFGWNPILVPTNEISHLFLGFNHCHDHYFEENKNALLPRFVLGPSYQNMTKLKVLSFGKPQQIHKELLFPGALNLYLINNNTFKAIQFLPNLTEIVVSGSDITQVDLTAITAFSHLKFVDFSRNKISHLTSVRPEQISPVDFLNCKIDYKLVLSYNLLTKLRNSNLVHPQVTYLDLSYNLLSSTHDNLFKNMPCLKYIDLRHNPLQFIHEHSFYDAKHLKALYLSSTYAMTVNKAVFFLRYFRSVTLTINLRLMNDNLFRLLSFNSRSVKAHAVRQADLSQNKVSSKLYFETGLRTFRYVRTLKLCMCDIAFSTFTLPTPNLTYLDLSQNRIDFITIEMLQSIPQIETLLLSYNKIKFVSNNVFNVSDKLQHLDLSHNLISRLSAQSETLYFQSLKKLELQYNYIYELSQTSFPDSFLSQLDYIDLRWNSFECSCDLRQNFGRWLSKGAFNLSERPGLLPRCSFAMSNFGGCVKCTTAKQEDGSFLQQSLLQYATNNFCSNSTNIIFAATFTSFCFLFTLLGLFFTSNKGMLWMAKFATRRVRSMSESDERNVSSTFAFHGFVVFDTDDREIGDWVDDHLLPNLTQKSPKFRIAIVVRDDQCGFPPVKQLLLKIETSRKVIVVLTKKYRQSNQGKYVMSLLETLHYQRGNDRLVIVTFKNDFKVGGLLGRLRKDNPWSQLQFPDDERDWPLFWESLRSSLSLS